MRVFVGRYINAPGKVFESRYDGKQRLAVKETRVSPPRRLHSYMDIGQCWGWSVLKNGFVCTSSFKPAGLCSNTVVVFLFWQCPCNLRHPKPLATWVFAIRLLSRWVGGTTAVALTEIPSPQRSMFLVGTSVKESLTYEQNLLFCWKILLELTAKKPNPSTPPFSRNGQLAFSVINDGPKKHDEDALLPSAGALRFVSRLRW